MAVEKAAGDPMVEAEKRVVSIVAGSYRFLRFPWSNAKNCATYFAVCRDIVSCKG